MPKKMNTSPIATHVATEITAAAPATITKRRQKPAPADAAPVAQPQAQPREEQERPRRQSASTRQPPVTDVPGATQPKSSRS
jgi:hypothetical protein